VSSKILRQFTWLYYDLIWIFKLLSKNKNYRTNNVKYSIGITTYKDRYYLFFKKVLRRITFLFPDTEIIVAVNGHVDIEKQLIYLKKIEALVSHYANVKLIEFSNPQGLSKLWNQIILKATNERIFILNDDIRFSPYIRREVERSNFFNERIAIINNSFSFFILEKKLAKEVGGFDERFLEISGEDDDFCVRLVILGYSYPAVYKYKFISNYNHRPKVNSYGKKTEHEANSYSTYNNNFLNMKWEIKNEKFEGSVYSRGGKYWKLKQGMESPDFIKQDTI
jgi:GT2 family glycosyltransferase